MARRRKIDWPYVMGLLLLPMFVMGAILLIAFIQGLTRYNPIYFSEVYQERYEVPNPLLTDLETALQKGNAELLAELQGTRGLPRQLSSQPKIRFLNFWESSDRYSDYLFIDTSDYRRYMQHVKYVGGRYVRVPDGLYYLVNSGRWVRTFGPIAVVWWIVVILFTIGTWIYRSMAAYRQKHFGELPPDQKSQIN